MELTASDSRRVRGGGSMALLFKGDSSRSPNDPYILSLAQVGIDAHVIPPLSFNFINRDALIDFLKCPSDFSGIIFTSPRCVEAVALAFHNIRDDFLLDKWRTTKTFFAVGNATAEAACTKLGFKCMGSESGSGDVLLPCILETMVRKQSDDPKRLLYPCGNLSDDRIPSALISDGIQVEQVVAYETCANPFIKENLCNFLEQNPEIMVFFSPSGVNNVLPILLKLLAEHNRQTDEIKFVSIGPTTTTALRALELNIWCQAAKPNPQSLVEVIVSKLGASK